MKRNIGSQLTLYPTPVTVIGAVSGAKEDKAGLFVYEIGVSGTPVIEMFIF